MLALLHCCCFLVTFFKHHSCCAFIKLWKLWVLFRFISYLWGQQSVSAVYFMLLWAFSFSKCWTWKYILGSWYYYCVNLLKIDSSWEMVPTNERLHRFVTGEDNIKYRLVSVVSRAMFSSSVLGILLLKCFSFDEIGFEAMFHPFSSPRR